MGGTRLHVNVDDPQPWGMGSAAGLGKIFLNAFEIFLTLFWSWVGGGSLKKTARGVHTTRVWNAFALPQSSCNVESSESEVGFDWDSMHRLSKGADP